MITRVTLALLIVVACDVVCRAQSTIAAGSAPPETVEQALAQRGFRDDTSSLLAALRSTDQIARGLAASELAGQGNVASVEAIKSAFVRSDLAVPRFNIAQALLKLTQKQAQRC